MKNCTYCTKVFTAKSWREKLCSDECRRLLRRNALKEWYKSPEGRAFYLRKKVGKLLFKDCKICKKTFQATRHGYKKVCSAKCSALNRKQNGLAYCRRPEYILQKELKRKKNKDAWNAYARAYSKTQQNKLYRKKYLQDPEKKLYAVLRHALHVRIKVGDQRTSKFILYSRQALKEHLEKQFLPGMTWKNYGRRGWHIDHIKPLSAFAFFTKTGKLKISEVQKAMALSNLQPLWAGDNIRKGGIRRSRVPAGQIRVKEKITCQVL